MNEHEGLLPATGATGYPCEAPDDSPACPSCGARWTLPTLLVPREWECWRCLAVFPGPPVAPGELGQED